jgi:hypothetical protein
VQKPDSEENGLRRARQEDEPTRRELNRTKQRRKQFEKGATKETIKNTAPPVLLKRSPVALFSRSVSLLTQDQLIGGSLIIASAQFGQESPNRGSVKTEVGPFRVAENIEVSNEELLSLAPINPDRNVAHNTSSPSPRATSRSWLRAIFV